MYKVSFYTPHGKISPIQEYLSLTEEHTRAKILTKIKYVQEFGLSRNIPDLKKVTNTPLWELRILGRDNIRIFCISLPNKEVKVIHIFSKKKQKAPLKEIKLALARCEEIMSRGT